MEPFVHSVKSFLRLWAFSAFCVFGYAVGDVLMNPWLKLETSFSLEPDWEQALDLVHWGGRLLTQGAWWLLLANAVVLGGLCALAGLGLAKLLSFRSKTLDRAPLEDRVSVFPASLPPGSRQSVPAPRCTSG
jgi:hypothetical protein